eukprot:gene15240-18039_t
MHSGIITASNQLWTFGSGSFGKLGLGSTEDYKIPMQVRPTISFAYVACANEHTLALSVDGQIYSWGFGRKGRLGLGNENASVLPASVYLPGLSTTNGRPIKVHAGGASSACITDTGLVFTWGYNKYGQLGLGHVTEVVNRPTQVIHFNSLVKPHVLSVGDRHMAAVDTDGFLYTWGSNAEYQLGDGSSFDKSTPTKLKVWGKFVHVACGGDYTTGVTDTADENGLYLWGTFPDYHANVPKKIATNVVSSSCSSDCGKNVLAICRNGEVLSFGWSRYGQAGIITDTVPLSRLESLVGEPAQVACGSYHSAVLYKSPIDAIYQLVKLGHVDLAYSYVPQYTQQVRYYKNYLGDSLLHVIAKCKVEMYSSIVSTISILINQVNKEGYPPFFYQGSLLKTLKSSKPDILFADADGQTCLHYYCKNAQEDEETDLKADTDAALDTGSKYTFANAPILKYDEEGFNQLLCSIRLSYSYLHMSAKLFELKNK